MPASDQLSLKAQRKRENDRKRKQEMLGDDVVMRGGQLYKVVKKTIFFRGAAFIIEEEISIDSGDDTSVRTSEDSFEVDDENVIA